MRAPLGDLLSWQRVNHFPEAKQLTRKDLLKRHMVRHQVRAPACMGRCAWGGVHGPACMGQCAWGGVHEAVCMGQCVWCGVHGSACMGRCALGVVPGAVCMGLHAWGSVHALQRLSPLLALRAWGSVHASQRLSPLLALQKGVASAKQLVRKDQPSRHLACRHRRMCASLQVSRVLREV